MLHHNLYEILGCLRLVETNNAHLPLLVILSSQIDRYSTEVLMQLSSTAS